MRRLVHYCGPDQQDDDFGIDNNVPWGEEMEFLGLLYG
jgi:hypothetical protein